MTPEKAWALVRMVRDQFPGYPAWKVIVAAEQKRLYEMGIDPELALMIAVEMVKARAAGRPRPTVRDWIGER